VIRLTGTGRQNGKHLPVGVHYDRAAGLVGPRDDLVLEHSCCVKAAQISQQVLILDRSGLGAQ
jgi:hypothetical protein